MLTVDVLSKKKKSRKRQIVHIPNSMNKYVNTFVIYFFLPLGISSFSSLLSAVYVGIWIYMYKMFFRTFMKNGSLYVEIIMTILIFYIVSFQNSYILLWYPKTIKRKPFCFGIRVYKYSSCHYIVNVIFNGYLKFHWMSL